MYLTLCYLSGLVYGGDVGRLGDREWRDRDAAQRRLEAAGWLAAPAVWAGLDDGCPERADRCRRAWGRCLGWPARVAARAVLDPAVDPEELVTRAPGVARLVCLVVDESYPFESVGDSWGWVERTPYRSGTLAGDFALVVKSARVRAAWTPRVTDGWADVFSWGK